MLKIVWTMWHRTEQTGYATVWNQLGARLPDYDIELLDLWRDDWDLAVFLGYPKAFLLGKVHNRPDVIWHTMWETDTLPDFWIPILNRGGMAWVPSAFCAHTYERAGVEVPIVVSGYGVDGDAFPFREREGEGFTFMAMGRIFGGRKGALKVLEAFLRLKEAGDIGDDARLVVKMSHLPWKHVTMDNVRRDDVELVSDKIPQSDLAVLYQQCDAFVYPSVAEGFALEPLEAMTTGACVLVTDWGGPQEYIRDDVCLRIPVKGTRSYPLEPYVDWGHVADVDYNAMKDQMLWCYEHRDEVREIGARAAQYVREKWTWQQAAERGAALLHEYAASLR